LVGPAYPFRGGIAHFNTLLAGEFAKDHKTLVINFKRLYPSIFFPGKTQFDSSRSPIDVSSERLIDSINPFSYYKAARRITDFRPDLVIFQWWHPFFAPAYSSVRFFLKKKCNCRIVYLCHNVMPHESSFLDRFLIKLGFSGVRRFLVQSSEDERKLKSLLRKMKTGEAHTAVSPHPVYEVFRSEKIGRAEARSRLGVEGRMILFFGYIRKYKGLGVLLKAFAEASRTLRMKLFIVGEFYDDKSKYDSLIKQLGIDSKIEVIDRYVPNEEVELYFEAADLVVLPYLSATQSGIVQISYAFDTPVIVTSVGGLPDVVEDGVTGRVVRPNDPAGLADAVVDFFSSSRAESMIDGVKRARKRFSWAGCAAVIMELYKAP